MISEPDVLAAESVIGAVRDGDLVEAVVQFRALGQRLPHWLGTPAAVTAALDDANRTKLVVRSVHVDGDQLHVVVAGVGTAERFTLRFARLARGSNSVTVSLDDAAFDPAKPPSPPEPAASRTLADYLAKDFRSFKRLMLDSISHKLPGFVERHEADTTIALIEVLAFAADNLSYYQDAVATEAYLETARRRVSVRRHARLTGYRLSEGCTPRVWLHLALQQSTAFLLTRDVELKASTGAALNQTDRVFEPLADVMLDWAVNEMTLWDDGHEDVVLKKGATSATLVRSRPSPGVPPALVNGSVLVFEESPDRVTGMPAARRNRQAVRLNAEPIDRECSPPDPAKVLTDVAWWQEDALTIGLRARNTIVRGNIVPADYGETMDPIALAATAFSDETATLRVPLANLTFAVPYSSDEPAKAFTSLDPCAAVPALNVTATSFDEPKVWNAKPDLIAADPFEPAFAVEVERSGSLLLRFGDGTNGWRPDPSSRFTLRYRRGNGLEGHVGANTIAAITCSDTRVVSVTNPLPSSGGQPPEEIAKAKRRAPDDIRRQRHCIADDDYVRVAHSVPGVSAYAKRRWTGDRTTVEVYVHAPGDVQPMRERVRAALASARLIGADVVVRPPRRVGVVVRLQVTCAPGAHRQDVAHRVAGSVKDALAKQKLMLGSTLFSSWLIVAAQDVEGAAEVNLLTFARLDGLGNGEGCIAFGPTELAVFVDEGGIPTNGLPLVEMVADR